MKGGIYKGDCKGYDVLMCRDLLLVKSLMEAVFV